MKQILAASLCVLIAAAAMADGKMFWREAVPPEIPYQRAVLHFREGVETLILQSKYATAVPEAEPSLGWVVPVPSEPEIASIHPLFADSLFGRLSWRTGPRVTKIRPVVFKALFWEAGALTVLSLGAYLLLSFVRFPVRLGEKQRKLRRTAERLFAISITLFVFVFIFLLGSPRGRMTEGVEVISEHTVGVYDVSVIRSDDSGDLIAWLNAHQFEFGEEDRAAFDAYINDGWCFAVATIAPSNDEDAWGLQSEGLAAPLVLRFPHESPVYPLRLTGTGGFDTEVLVYLASNAKMMCDDRLALRFARATDSISTDLDTLSQRPHSDYIPVEPAGFFRPGDLDCSYICKFKGTLTPAQMSQDLVFQPADDPSNYREHIVEW